MSVRTQKLPSINKLSLPEPAQRQHHALNRSHGANHGAFTSTTQHPWPTYDTPMTKLPNVEQVPAFKYFPSAPPTPDPPSESGSSTASSIGSGQRSSNWSTLLARHSRSTARPNGAFLSQSDNETQDCDCDMTAGRHKKNCKAETNRDELKLELQMMEDIMETMFGIELSGVHKNPGNVITSGLIHQKFFVLTTSIALLIRLGESLLQYMDHDIERFQSWIQLRLANFDGAKEQDPTDDTIWDGVRDIYCRSADKKKKNPACIVHGLEFKNYAQCRKSQMRRCFNDNMKKNFPSNRVGKSGPRHDYASKRRHNYQ